MIETDSWWCRAAGGGSFSEWRCCADVVIPACSYQAFLAARKDIACWCSEPFMLISIKLLAWAYENSAERFEIYEQKDLLNSYPLHQLVAGC